MRILTSAVFAVAVMLVAMPTGPSFAACTARDCPPDNYSGAPGPIVGAGLPVLVVLGGAYYVVRRRRRNKA
jgi:uncharacterized membrane protein YphA (DoxX/SURF4 family)